MVRLGLAGLLTSTVSMIFLLHTATGYWRATTILSSGSKGTAVLTEPCPKNRTQFCNVNLTRSDGAKSTGLLIASLCSSSFDFRSTHTRGELSVLIGSGDIAIIEACVPHRARVLSLLAAIFTMGLALMAVGVVGIVRTPAR